MNTPFRTRLSILLAAVVVVAVLTAWAVHHSWQHTTELESKLTGSHLESFRLADDFQQRLLKLNNSMLRYSVRREPVMWNEFEHASSELDKWIDQYDPRVNQSSRLTSDLERELFKQLNDSYDGYLAASRQVHTNHQPASVSAADSVQLSEFEGQAERLLQLGLRLAEAHRVAAEAFLDDANQSLTNLRNFLFGALALLLVLVALDDCESILSVLTYLLRNCRPGVCLTCSLLHARCAEPGIARNWALLGHVEWKIR